MLVTTLYCKISSRLLSFGPCSKVPKPMVLNLPVAETFAKSARLPSKLATAAIPPLLSISARRSSLNQTSPLIRLGFNGCCGVFNSSVWFFTPTINVLTNPKLGFPRIPSLNLFTLPEAEGFISGSSSFL